METLGIISRLITHTIESDRKNIMKNLTRREVEILSYALKGIPNKEIAQVLGISYRTVEVHRRRILKKTGAHNFLELIRLCEDPNFILKFTT